MKGYLAVFTARFRVLLEYRAAALAGLTTQLFWGWVRVMIFSAFYAHVSSVQPMTLAEVINYIWLGQAFIILVIVRADEDIQAMFMDGTVAYELARPVDLYLLWFSRGVALRSAPMLMRAVPIFIVAGLFGGLQAPASWLNGSMYLISTLAAILLGAVITANLAVLLFYTISGTGINYAAPGIIMFFSGMIVPVPLMPRWLETVTNFLPFRGLADTPFRIYMGHFSYLESAAAILHQCLWIAVLIVIGRLVLSRAVKRVVVQGG